MILGYSVPQFPGSGWVSPVLGTVMYFWGGRPFLTGAISEIRSRAPGMMLLIGLAITVAFVSSWGASLGVLDHQLDFWWELALLIVIMLLGHWIEMRSLAQTSSALDSLAALLPDEAERVEGDDIVTVAPSDLRLGDVVIVRPGGSVPADGEIVDGAADIDESMVTGESVPVRRGVGDDVVAGTVATDSGLRIRVTAVGDDTALAGIQRLVTEAQNSSSRAQRLADTRRGLAVLVRAGRRRHHRGGVGRRRAGRRRPSSAPSPCWSSPARTRSGWPSRWWCPSPPNGQPARGVLVKDRLALESMRTVDAVLFDKTGTLTKGEPSVTARGRDGRAQRGRGAGAGRGRRGRLRAPAGPRHRGRARSRRSSDVPAASRLLVVARGRGDRHGRRPPGPRRRTATAGTGRADRAARSRRRGTAKARSCCTSCVDGPWSGALKLADEVRPESRQAVDALARGWASRS